MEDGSAMQCSWRRGSRNDSTSDSENGLEANSRKLPSSKYKGVVPQSNGRWGAQIYEKQQRVWLGTFNEEEEAGKAYDIAAIRFRGHNAITNLKETNHKDGSETIFLNSHSKEEIVEMLRSHTYVSELQQFKHKNVVDQYQCESSSGKASSAPESCREWLFEKAVTPSDVGKLHRMVIPKKQAELHFPLPSESASEGVILSFEDSVGKVWRFRYCFWSSSQSYVLTKGWSRFVKEKKLKAGDLVSFQRWTWPEEKLFIDCRPGKTERVVKLFGVEILKTCTSNI
ncbi:hypothetical protein FNV43_RR13606 [Rhamnella rubrinervis]|uniref:AP2/ERF and B3 domain-containing transcription factor RAV1-like n=1 Tax=Rhamnella rubrinervis TaxID=2594499 RepID=A0A8K0MFD8_9ROSA|nr:hypothetical protein FNV43_RR13606 [Rhamnella rubrinervis]